MVYAYLACVKAGLFDWYCVDLEQGRLNSRDVPFGPDEGSAWYRPPLL